MRIDANRRREFIPLAIRRDAARYPPPMDAAANYAVVEDVARLPVKVMEVYRRLTT